MDPPALPVLDLSLASSPSTKPLLLINLKSALFRTGFLYLTNHGISPETIAALASRVPALFSLALEFKAGVSKRNSPHFIGYSGYAEEETRGKRDLREQFDFASELPVVWESKGGKDGGRDFTKLYWRLRGPNQWPDEKEKDLDGFRNALENYMKAVEGLSLRFVHLIEEAFDIPVGWYFLLLMVTAPILITTLLGTFDSFFTSTGPYLPPQHRLKIIKYPPSVSSDSRSQGVGAHKDSSGWLTFLLQLGKTPEEAEGLQVLNPQNSRTEEWIPVPLIPNSFVVNFGNAFEAATSGGVRATVHQVLVRTLPDTM